MVNKVEYVEFFNTRTNVHYGRLPWYAKSYRHPVTKQSVIFARIPLCEEQLDQNGELKHQMYDGKPVLWGESLDFVANPNKVLRLHPTIHAKVIQAIRDYPETVTTKKSEGVGHRTNGQLNEYEPKVLVAKKKAEMKSKMEVLRTLSGLHEQKDLNLVHQIAALLGIITMQAYEDIWTSIMQLAELNAKSLMDLVRQDEDGKIVLKNGLNNRAIVLMAIQWGAITNNGGEYFVDSVSLGTDQSKIHINFEDRLALIQSKLEEKQGKLETA